MLYFLPPAAALPSVVLLPPLGDPGAPSIVGVLWLDVSLDAALDLRCLVCGVCLFCLSGLSRLHFLFLFRLVWKFSVD